MRELPEPEGQLAWQTYTRDQVLAIQKQAYEDGLRDAASKCSDVSLQAMTAWKLAYQPIDQGRELGADDCEAEIVAMLTASQKEAP